jgi:hypothetical protein
MKKNNDGHVMDKDTLDSITRVVWRFYLWPRKLLTRKCTWETRWGLQRVVEFKLWETDDKYPPKVIGQYWSARVWADQGETNERTAENNLDGG